MIQRIVRMSFHPEKSATFNTIFNQSKSAIRSFPGCQHLELWQQENQASVFFTFSKWNSAADLENYRQSELFKTTWSATKVLFIEKPFAYSVEVLEQVELPM